MYDDKGNVWKEDNYEGYGEFGGKDYYELVAEMNGLISNRQAGIDIAFKHSLPNPDIKYPNLTETPYWTWRPEEADLCNEQGYFYEDEE